MRREGREKNGVGTNERDFVRSFVTVGAVSVVPTFASCTLLYFMREKFSTYA